MSATIQDRPTRLLHRPKQVQDQIGIGNTKFWELVKTGALDTRKIGRATLVTDESLKAFVAGLPGPAVRREAA